MGRQEAIRRYAFAVPGIDAMNAIAAWAPHGIVEIGAGTGYWAHALASHGLDVVAYDLHPPQSQTNTWFHDADPWFDVRPGGAASAAMHPERCLLLVWPTKNETWAADTVRTFHDAGGDRMVYVGEPPGGRTGDDQFHALIGELQHCYHCAYDIVDTMCVCDAPVLYRRKHAVPIPNWAGFHDVAVLLARDEPTTERRRRRLTRRRARPVR